jgi:hypothetical protein
VTLILGMSKAEGIYLSVDCRITDAHSGRLLNDSTVKFVIAHYRDGMKALFAYTGIAWLPNGTRIGKWLQRRLNEGPPEFDRSVEYLHGRLDRDLASFREGLVVDVLAVRGAERYFAGFSNTDWFNVTPTFQRKIEVLTKPFSFGTGAGAAQSFSKHVARHTFLLSEQVGKRPSNPHDHMNLLATVNRRVADEDSRISPHCHAAFISTDSHFESAQAAFPPKYGPSTSFDAPIVDLRGKW